ncbi:hypothetical protein K435DRAFT_799300 [Dendrothele bispora CBS 962.96]|uniref:Uncharacterized protein n=1 Tax=Dendrothele bispora (strain CBS 962.96) TaxID=1314807 RepID=A0A4S8LXI5_DENBC|nr:hypothetical protein K435DRAFT_799300 [Dendrothele bispora CBS 962.96]
MLYKLQGPLPMGSEGCQQDNNSSPMLLPNVQRLDIKIHNILPSRSVVHLEIEYDWNPETPRCVLTELSSFSEIERMERLRNGTISKHTDLEGAYYWSSIEWNDSRRRSWTAQVQDEFRMAGYDFDSLKDATAIPNWLRVLKIYGVSEFVMRKFVSDLGLVDHAGRSKLDDDEGSGRLQLVELRTDVCTDFLELNVDTSCRVRVEHDYGRLFDTWSDWGDEDLKVLCYFHHGRLDYNKAYYYSKGHHKVKNVEVRVDENGEMRDNTNELNGVHSDTLPTPERPDPSPWDHWNELSGKPWRDGFFRNEDGSPVPTDPHSQLESGYDAVGDEDGDAAIEALICQNGPRRDVKYRATFRVFQILGQPGIGKSMSLYAILAQRLMAKKPTFLQNKRDVVVFFCSTGAYEVRITDHEEPDWAKKLTEEELFLFDSNEVVLQPADFWRFFPVPIVEAASPRPQRTEWARKMKVKKWYMRPMSLNEFLVASRFQSQKGDKTRLARFYMKYGPNARQAYDRCRDPGALTEHVQDVRNKLPLDKLSLMITEYNNVFNPSSVSHLLMLVTAGPTRRMDRTGFISHDLFQLVRACLQLRKMCDSGTGKTNAIYIIDHPAEWLQVGPTIQLSAHSDFLVGSLPFQFYDHTEVLHRGVYGQPTHSIDAAFDAYFWNETQKTVWMLQFTVSDEHDVKPSGVKWIKDRIPDGVEIRFVVFSPEEHVRLFVPKTITEITYIYHVHISNLESLVQTVSAMRIFGPHFSLGVKDLSKLFLNGLNEPKAQS